MPRSKPKLVVVSNRGPYRHEVSRGKERWVRSAGGLVAALDPVLQQRGGVWISAKQAKDFDTIKVPGPRLEYDLAYISLSRAQEEGFYEGVSNAVLWPLLHSFPPTIHVGEARWRTYTGANERFAQVVLEASRSNDLIWVHDYHLMLVPRFVRNERARARIGWFCHVPWPPAHMFGILPWRQEILEGLLASDVIGFHIDEYVQYFLECVERFTDYKVSRNKISVGDRTVSVITAPIGIAVRELKELANDPDVETEVQRIRHSVGNRRMILGVDRLDYTKGIPERLLAFERLLMRNPKARNNYVFVQVMVPSRTDVRAYAELKDNIDRMVGDINGRYSETGRLPIHYLYRNLSQRALVAHYRAADIALLTPLRDGMNLVAQEYVASRIDDDGVLVLSEFTGAAHHLTDALLVNPYDVEGVTNAIDTALRMPRAEAAKRMRALQKSVERLDVHRWADTYLAKLEES
ncbi:MAG: trehalose-6-phosphate synthase [Polyangiales bacterium]